MSEKKITFPGHDKCDDKESDTVYTKQLLKGKKHSVNLNVSSDINKITKKETWEIKKKINKKPRAQLSSAHVDLIDTVNIIDTFDRPADASAERRFARAGKYAHGPEHKPGKRIPKAGVYAEAGVGRARAEASVFEAEAKGPNASAEAVISVVGARVMAQAEIASASAKAGPVGVKVGLGLDTGASVGVGGVEAKFLGTGFSIGPKTSVSVLGSEVSCSVM